jgi:hypothetical protein
MRVELDQDFVDLPAHQVAGQAPDAQGGGAVRAGRPAHYRANHVIEDAGVAERHAVIIALRISITHNFAVNSSICRLCSRSGTHINQKGDPPERQLR